MIKCLEKSGRTEDEAVAAALAELGMDRDDVSVTVVERAKSGFLGIGASPAVVRVEYEAPDEPAVEEVKSRSRSGSKARRGSSRSGLSRDKSIPDRTFRAHGNQGGY